MESMEWMKQSLIIGEELTAAQPIPQWKLNGMLMKLSLIWWRDGVELKGAMERQAKQSIEEIFDLFNWLVASVEWS